MKMTAIRVRPMLMPLKVPYVWSQGIERSFVINLIEIEGEDGLIGYGETTTAPDAMAQKLVIEKMARFFIGHAVGDFNACAARAFKELFLVFGANMPRYFNQMISGLEMAALDLQGKHLGCPVWDLLGGAVRDEVGYFHFLQGESTDELVADARAAVAARAPVIYLKVGLGRERDVANVSAVRAAIGKARLRLDANEAWDPATALAMIDRFAPYGIEYLEQPTHSGTLSALKRVTDRSPVPIGADQAVFTLHDVMRACETGAADMIAVGPREIGGLRAMKKAAAVAEGAGMNICIHSSMTTGITTCAEHHLGRATPNLDDGNQIMWQLLEHNIVASPPLTPRAGALALPARPGLGVELDQDEIAAAHERFRKASGARMS